MKRRKWIYKNILLSKYIDSIMENKDDAEFLYFTICSILREEYHEGVDLDKLIDDIFNLDKIKKIINGDYVKLERTTWVYKGIPLKEYLNSLLSDKKESKYLYSVVRKYLKKEYHEGDNLDELIHKILKRDKIKEILNGTYQKQEKQEWFYKRQPLKEYLASIVSNKEDLNYLYMTVRRILDQEYSLDVSMDNLIDDVLRREKIKEIICGDYEKVTEVKWYYDGYTLKDYINNNITSCYHDAKKYL